MLEKWKHCSFCGDNNETVQHHGRRRSMPEYVSGARAENGACGAGPKIEWAGVGREQKLQWSGSKRSRKREQSSERGLQKKVIIIVC